MNLSEPASLDLDRTICTIESLSRLLTAVTQAEEADIDPHWLADLGRVISQQAMQALEIVAGETKYGEGPPLGTPGSSRP